MNDDNPKPPNVDIVLAGVMIDKHYNPSPTPINTRPLDLVREFKKGIKRDQNLSPILIVKLHGIITMNH